jgi:hypothetical protein
MRQHWTDPTTIEAEIARIRSLPLDALRRRWRVMFGRTPPAALNKDLLGRMMAWRLQEQAFGSLDRESLRFLDGLARHPSIFSTARPASLTPQLSGTATRRRCWRTSRPSRSARFQSASRCLPRRSGWSISWKHCAAASPRTPKEPRRARKLRQSQRANGREYDAAVRRNAAAGLQP